MDATDKPNSVGTELSVIVRIEDGHIFVVHQFNPPDPVEWELLLQSTKVVQQHLRSLFVAVDKQDCTRCRVDP